MSDLEVKLHYLINSDSVYTLLPTEKAIIYTPKIFHHYLINLFSTTTNFGDPIIAVTLCDHFCLDIIQ